MPEETQNFELMEPVSPEALVPDLGLWPWFAGAGVLALLIVVALVVFRKRKTAGPDIQAIRKAAFAEATAAFENIHPENARESAVLSSLVLRKYLSAAADDPALFETHEEFVARRDSLLTLTPEARATAEEGFTRLAALKYAPEIPAAEPARVVADSRALLETLHHGFAA
jgi:hypothetical protein